MNNVWLCGLTTVLILCINNPVHASDKDIDTSEDREHVESKSPDNSSRIYGDIVLKSADDYELFIHNGILKKDRVLIKTPFRYSPIIIWHGNDIVQITIGTESPGQFSVFYDLKNDKVSDELWFVLTFDKENKIALTGEEDLRIMDVFNDKELMKVVRDDAVPTAITFLIAEESFFDASGNLHIKYQNKDGGVSSVLIKYQEFQKKR